MWKSFSRATWCNSCFSWTAEVYTWCARENTVKRVIEKRHTLHEALSEHWQIKGRICHVLRKSWLWQWFFLGSCRKLIKTCPGQYHAIQSVDYIQSTLEKWKGGECEEDMDEWSDGPVDMVNFFCSWTCRMHRPRYAFDSTTLYLSTNDSK